MRFSFTCVLAAVMALAAGAGAQEILQPPYGMRWGDSPEKMIEWAGRHHLDIHIFMPGDQAGLRVVRIESRDGVIPETEVRSVEGRFLRGRMIELAAHYDDPELPFELMLARFDKFRKELAAAHGAMQPNRAAREVEDGFVIRTRSFHREPVKGLFLLLTLTTIEDQARGGGKARYSVIYRNENLRADLDRPTPGR